MGERRWSSLFRLQLQQSYRGMFRNVPKMLSI